ncbi:thiol reductant ABC exporter subunit CydD [Ancylobacter terrae]|uniref:thiol reductant ABC exporter subunit CydD n=1 Tax=Ancylobacter sp. sgz301288 TaxID=3342077 RepID=UPI00385F58E4
MSDRRPGSRAGAWLQLIGALMWIPQAALLALAAGNIAAGGGVAEVMPAAAGVLALGLLRAALEAAGGRLAFRTARTFLSRARAAATARLAAHSPFDIERPASGLAAGVLAEQAEMIVPYLARYAPARLKATVVPLAILAVILPISWAAALMLAVAGPAIPFFMALIGWQAQAASEKQLAELGTMNAFLLDRLRGLATLRSFGAVDLTATRLRSQAERVRQRTMAVLRIAFLSSAVLELFAAFGVAAVAIYIGFDLLGQIGYGAWGGRLSLGEALFILLLAPAYFEPLRDLAAVWHDRASGEAAISAIDGLAAEGPVLLGADGAAPASVPSAPPAIHLAGVCVRHAGASAPALDGFDLAVSPGEHVALFGPSGAGKSTLLGLIAGLVSMQSGEVRVDGVPLDAAGAAALRARIAWIGQQPHVFAGSMSANIALGRPGVDPAAISDALRFAALDDVAARRAGALLGEGGAGLSGGEALRLALARAAAAPAGLILADEPTAHLDAATAAAITEGILALAQGRTLVVATHDPVLAARMDRIVRLEAPR